MSLLETASGATHCTFEPIISVSYNCGVSKLEPCKVLITFSGYTKMFLHSMTRTIMLKASLHSAFSLRHQTCLSPDCVLFNTNLCCNTHSSDSKIILYIIYIYI